MRKLVLSLVAMTIMLSFGAVQASADGGSEFAFFYQFLWLRDADGDGIPNCQDDDWVRPQDGEGYGVGKGLLTTGGLFDINITADDELKTRSRKEYRHGGGNPDAQHDRDRVRDQSCL